MKIVRDRLGIFDARALGISIVVAQYEGPTPRPCKELIEEGGPSVADVNAPCGRWREADDGIGHERFMAEPV